MFISEYYCPATSPRDDHSRIDNPLAMLRDHNGDGEFSENEIFIFTKDHLNSVREITDHNQKLIQRYNYSAYGKTKLERIAGGADIRFVENYFTYTSREWEPEIGIIYYRARFYNPSTGRFLSSDPIEFDAQDTNFYRYVENNPVNYSDPFGLVKNNMNKLMANDGGGGGGGGMGGGGGACRITGFTKHGINNAISRDNVGVNQRSMLNAVSNPIQTIQQPGKTKFVGQDATVILNSEGKVITTWPNNSDGWRGK